MAKNIKDIAKALGAEIVGQVPDVGGGAFGAARLPHVVQTLKERLNPDNGRRPSRPIHGQWIRVPMSDDTLKALHELAERISSADRKVSPIQVAAQILEEAVASSKNE